MSKIDTLVNQVVSYCKQRYPEALDSIFDNLPVTINEQVLAGATVILLNDIDTFSWLCGYFAGEINCSQDNSQPFHPIVELSKILLKSGMEVFADFTPYPGRRLVISNIEKFESLPDEIKVLVRDIFTVMEASGEQAKQINDALLAEMVVQNS